MSNTTRIDIETIRKQKDRMKDNIIWFPAPALISFALVLLLIGHLLVNINPRLGNSAEILSFPSKPQKEGSIWISIFEKDSEITVVTYDRKVFNWPADTQTLEPLEDFRQYLHQTTNELSAQAAISKFISRTQTQIVMAVDQKLRYFHIRPLIHILADVGIDSYAFETQIIDKQENDSNTIEKSL